MDGQNTVLSVVGPLGTTASSLRLVTKALLSQQPWLHDPLVHEIPWRSAEEGQIQQLLQFIGEAVPKEKRLAFGIIHTDGVVTPTAPIRRAIELVTKALEAAGHEIIPWAPPSHKVLNDTGFKSWVFDGGRNVREAFELSSEPMAEQISLYNKEMKEFSATEIAETNVAMRGLKKGYMEYWNSTVKDTTTGRPVDAVISPLAPWPAARKTRYKYYGYSTWVNALDYTSVVFPVTNVDKSIDVKSSDFKPISDQDQEVQDDCKRNLVVKSIKVKTLTRPQMIRRFTMEHMSVCRLWAGGCKKRRCWRSLSMWVN